MWEYSHEGKQLENKWVFRRLQKTGKVCADVMSGGRLFQSHDDLLCEIVEGRMEKRSERDTNTAHWL